MNIINVGDPRTISLLAGQTISVTTTGTITATCVSGLGLTAGATIGSIHGSTVFGSYSADGVIKLTATNRDGAYELNTDTTETIKSVTGATGLDVLDAGSREVMANSGVNTSLRCSPYLTKGNMTGRLNTASVGGADHTSQHCFTFETAPGYLRVLVGNNLGVALTNIKVSYAALPTFAATDNLANATLSNAVISGFTLTPSPQVSSPDMVGRQVTGTGVTASTVVKAANADGTYTVNISQTVASTTITLAVAWVGLNLAGASTWASVAAGSATHTIDNPNYTVSDWAYEVVTNPICIDRQDGGTLPIGVVRVESPVASNANIPISYWGTTTAFETEGVAGSPGSPGVEPFGRFYKCRTQAVLGVTTKAAFTSTAMAGNVIPIIIQYQPRDFAAGASLMVIGNSLDEGVNSGATARRPGWVAEMQSYVSTPQRPLEIVNLAIHGAAASRYADRMVTMTALLKCEYVMLPWYNINSATVSGSTNQAAIDVASMLGQFNIGRISTDSYNPVLILPTGLPTNWAARQVLNVDTLRLTRNAAMVALPKSGRVKVLDIATPFSGPVDANGQTTIVANGTSDQLHDNDFGRTILATAGYSLFNPMLQGAL